MPFTPFVVITDPQMGDLPDFTGQAFVQSGMPVAVLVTSLQYRATSLGSGSSAGHILVAMTKTGDFTAATSFHSFPVTLDGAVHDLGSIDFSSELSLSNTEAASGLVGVIVDWSGTFANVKVELAQPTVAVGFSVSAGTATGSGLVYAEFDNCDEYVAIASGGMYSLNGQFVPLASANNWSGNLAPSGTTLNALFWEGCQFGSEEFITEPSTGVFRRTICGKDSLGNDQPFVPLYQDYVNPGSNGAGLAQIIVPPYLDHSFVSGSDTIALVTNTSGITIVPTIDATSNKPTFHVTSTGGWAQTGAYEYEIDLAVAIDFSTTGQFMEYLMLHYVASKTLNGSGAFADGDLPALGFQNTLANYQIRFADTAGFIAGHQTTYVQAGYVSALNNSSQRDMEVFYDLNSTQGTFPAIMAAVKKIRIRFGPRNGAASYYRLDEFQPLGQYYHYNLANGRFLTPATAPNSDGSVVWAYNYTEGANIGKAVNIQLTDTQALGTRPTIQETGLPDTAVPLGGTFVNVTIPAAPAPFTTAALQNIYRAETHTGQYQRVAQSGSSITPFVFADILTDGQIQADTTTYPIVSLSFAPLTAADSGQATNMINCCSWRGSLIFFGLDGQAYGSQTNNAQVFFWPNTSPDLTGVAANAVPRTLQIANNQGLPVLVGVPGAVLYMFTRKECYTMTSVDTFADANDPTKADGCRGVVGTRAACAYGAGALFGSDDGLWYIAVNPYQPIVTGNQQPDALTEITKTNAGLWAKLLGSASDQLVVQSTGDDIWCFCQDRYIHIDMRRGRIMTYGEWATGKSVSMARGDAARGMVVLFSDGSMGVCGPYLTDGALDVNGATGNPPSWFWKGRRFTDPLNLLSVRAVYENQLAGAQPAMGQVTAFSARGSVSGDSIDFTDPGGYDWKPFDTSIVGQNLKIGGDFFEIQVSGAAWDKVTKLQLHLTQDQPKRSLR